MVVHRCTSWIAVSGRYDSLMVIADCQAGNGSGANVSRAAQQAATPFDVRSGLRHHMTAMSINKSDIEPTCEEASSRCSSTSSSHSHAPHA